MAACWVSGKFILKQDISQYKLLPFTLLPQAGTLLGLVNEVATYGPWAKDFVGAIIATLLINNLIGLRLL
jgi:hypothetical protein